MALRRAPALAVQFQGGLETKQDSKQVPSLKLLNLENATFIKQTTLAKRNGYESLGRRIDETGLVMPASIGLATRSDELIAFDGSRAWSYRDSSGSWNDAGEVVSVVQSDRVLARTGTKQTSSDHATNGGLTVAAWVDSRGGVWCEAVEAEGGRSLFGDVQLDALGSRPRCVPCGTVVLVLWAKASTSEMWCAVINPNNAIVTPVPVMLTGDLSGANPSFDACAMGGSFSDIEPALIAWANSAGGYRVGYVHPSGVLGSPLNGLPSVASWADTMTGPIAVAFDKVNASGIGVLWVNGTSATLRIVDESVPTTSLGTATVATAGAAFLRVTCEWDDASLLWWVAEVDGGRSDLNYAYTGSVTAAAVVDTAGAARVLHGHCIASRAYHDGGAVYAGLVHAVKYFSYIGIAKVSAEVWGGQSRTLLAAQCLAGSSTGVLPNGHLPSTQAVDPDADMLSRAHALCLGYRIQLPLDPSQAASAQFTEDGIKLATLDHDNDASYQSAQLGAGLYLASACMQHYDGRTWSEAQILTAPDLDSGAASMATPVISGSGSIAAGAYNYVAAYEHVDALGELHRGAVSVPVTVTVGGGGTNAVSMALPTYRLTGRAHARIGVWRSEANQTGDPESIPYFRVTGIDPSATSGANCYVPNDPTDDTVTFVDERSDATLVAEGEPLYTNGGILSNDPAPCAGNAIAGAKGRLFWTDPSDGNVVRFSQQLDDDIALEASVSLSLRCDPYGGPVVAIGVMDNAVYPFKQTAVMVFGGPGPDADGGLSTPDAFSPVELVTADVGCSAPASICQSPEGIAFQSSKGIKLLDRQRNIVDIGSAVYAFNDQTVTRATLLPDRHQLVFLTADGSTLLFDYQRGQWSKYTNHEGYDAVVRAGVYHYVRTDGRVFRETPGVYRDDFSHITMKIETAWLSCVQYRQGWQRIWHALFLGAFKSDHTLRVRYRLDFQDAYAAPLEADVNANYNPSRYGDGYYGDGVYGGELGPSTVYQREFHLNQRCQAIAFEISDVEASGDFGASFELSELLLTGGAIGPRFQVGADRRG